MTLLFYLTFFAYILATILYVVYFVNQEKKIRTAARFVLVGAGLLHTANLVARYLAAGHTPISNMHEAVSFFAWAITWGFLSFRWRYRVKNFGTFVSILITILMVIAAISSQELTPLPPALRSNWLPFHGWLGRRSACDQRNINIARSTKTEVFRIRPLRRNFVGAHCCHWLSTADPGVG